MCSLPLQKYWTNPFFLRQRIREEQIHAWSRRGASVEQVGADLGGRGDGKEEQFAIFLLHNTENMIFIMY